MNAMSSSPFVSLCMPYYMNPAMLALQYANWVSWPVELRALFEIVLVDDGSPERPASEVRRPPGLPALRIYRVTEDRPWHQHAARNLAAKVATGRWLLLTDMDHVLERKAAEALWKRRGKLDPGTIYTLARVEADTGLPTMQHSRPKPHPNSFVVTPETFWSIGGYDEDYCGIYGTDGLFRSRAGERAKQGHLKYVPLTRYWRELVADASTTTLPRKEGREPGAKEKIAAMKAERGESGVVKVLQFDWEQVL